MTDQPSDDELRDGFRSLPRDAAISDDCPAAERLWAGARGELSPADVEGITLHLTECGACAEAWRVARDFGTPAALPAPKDAAVFPWWLAAAAAVVLAAGTAVYFGRPEQLVPAPPLTSGGPAFAIGIEKAPIAVSARYALTWRGPNGSGQFLAALKTALEPYERGDYPAAVTTLSAVAAQYGDLMEPAFYLGVSQLLSGSAAGAVTSLEHARDLADSDRSEEVTWYLAGAYERAGRRNDAQRVLQSVCDGMGPRTPSACSAAGALRSQP